MGTEIIHRVWLWEYDYGHFAWWLAYLQYLKWVQLVHILHSNA